MFLLSADEMDVALNQISDMNTRLVEMDRLRKQLEAGETLVRVDDRRVSRTDSHRNHQIQRLECFDRQASQ